MTINMIDEETIKRTEEVPKEDKEEDAYPKKMTLRHRIRDSIPFLFSVVNIM